MKGYACTNYFKAYAVELFERAVKLVEALPEPADVDSIRCHELARAVQIELWPHGTTTVVDGKFGSVEHSWLELGTGAGAQATYSRGEPYQRARIILDVYSVARTPMVQLVDPREWPVWLAPLYIAGPRREDINEAKVVALVNVWGRSPGGLP